MSFRIFVPDNVHPKAIEILKDVAEFDVDAPGKISREDTLAGIKEANALVIRSAVEADAELLSQASNLKVIARAGVGVDNIDLDAATEHGVIVMNTPGANTISTAEHTFGMMLALARHIPQGHMSLVAGRWDRKLLMGVELRGKTLGVIGFGRIGREVARRAQAFEMNVVAFDPFIPANVAEKVNVALVELDDLYAQSDFISLHAMVTPDTTGMVNADSIAKMKDGVRIVNAARGVLIDDEALASALRSGKVAGAALDVFSPEPPPTDHPLVGLDGVIHTPHLAASTHDAQVTVAIEASQLVVEALVNGVYQNVCNPKVL